MACYVTWFFLRYRVVNFDYIFKCCICQFFYFFFNLCLGVSEYPPCAHVVSLDMDNSLNLKSPSNIDGMIITFRFYRLDVNKEDKSNDVNSLGRLSYNSQENRNISDRDLYSQVIGSEKEISKMQEISNLQTKEEIRSITKTITFKFNDHKRIT